MYFVSKAGALALVVTAPVFVSCASVPQKLDLDVVWKKDLPYCIEGVGCYEGVSVVPDMPEYSIEIEPKGNADIDLVIFNTCHREEAFERTSRGWFIFKSKNRFKYYYNPVPGLETRKDCDLKANTLDEDEGKHGWLVMRREHQGYKLPVKMACNGKYQSYNGVSACQSKVGLVQRVEFSVPVQFATPPKGCSLPEKKYGGYEWRMSKGECIYIIRDSQDRRHSMFTHGYQGIPIRRDDD